MILGHQKQWIFLKRLAESGRFAHAYLFSGQEHLGKKKIALEWLSLFFNQNVEKIFHPDLIQIKPEDGEIKISQIRELIWRLSLKPSLAQVKAAIIDQAHTMNQEAQTSLLKTLEEPRGNALLILVSENPEYLFPTILSRVEKIKFFPLKKEEIRNYLKSQDIVEKESEEICQISLGRPGVMMAILSEHQKIAFFQEKIKELNKILSSSLAFRFQYVKNLADEELEIKETLEIWLAYFRDSLLKSLNEQKLMKILRKIQDTIFLLSTTNINPRLALESLMLEL